jgi:hypothetical protein
VAEAYVFRRKKKIRPLWIALAVFAGVSVATVGSLFAAGVFRPAGAPAPVFGDALPGSRASALSGLADVQYGTIADNAWKTSRKLLGKDAFLLSEARLASKDGNLPFETSGSMTASDQLLRLQNELEQDRRSSFLALQQAFAAAFVAGDGLVRPAEPESGQAESPLDSLFYARLLAEGYARWNDARLLSACRTTSDALLASLDAGGFLSPDRTAVLPTPAPTPTEIPDATPTAGPTPTPPPTPTPRPLRTLDVLGLSQADFEAMRLLSALDGRWTAVLDAHLAVVEGGFLSEDLPLYAEAYSTGFAGYLPYTGTSPWIDTKESLLVVLHLCEIGRADPRSLAWLRRQVMDVRAVYVSYELATGAPASPEESVPAYAIAARIARMTGDRALYLAAVDRIDWNLATDPNSKAFGAVFRKDDSGRVLVVAEDNLWAMLALE